MTDSFKEQIKKSRDIKDISLKTYLGSLKKLHKILDPKCKTGINDCKFLHDYDEVISVIEDEEKLTTKKNRLTAVLVALGSETPKDEVLIDKYGKYLKTLNEKYMTFIKKQKKTPTQKENWIDYSELVGITNRLMREVKANDILKKTSLNNKEFDLLQQYVILRTYITFPLRNDFSDMKVYKYKDFKKLSKEIQNKHNYLIIKSNNKMEFRINEFKNIKAIGEKILIIPTKLKRVIKMWLKYNTSGYFLVKRNQKDPMTPNNITKFLNKIFARLADGKKISTSMIRHIVISHLLKDQKTIAQKEIDNKKIENTFLHSAKMNELYRKVDDKNEEILP
jgi:integrase